MAKTSFGNFNKRENVEKIQKIRDINDKSVC